MENQKEVIVKIMTYHPSQKVAYHRYLEKNREKVNERQRERYKKMKEDPNFNKEEFNKKKRDYYIKKKINNQNLFSNIKEKMELQEI